MLLRFQLLAVGGFHFTDFFFFNIRDFSSGICSERDNVSLSDWDNSQTVISISRVVVLLMIIVTTLILSEIYPQSV